MSPTTSPCKNLPPNQSHSMNETLYDAQNKSRNSTYLNITKNSSAMGSYDDGIYYYFGGDRQPQHITFEMKTDDPDIETCDLRVTSINANQSAPYGSIPSLVQTIKVNATYSYNVTQPMPKLANFSKNQWQDVAFFRFGYFNYQKLNLVSMVNKFVDKQWYKVDLLINWDNQDVTIYVNETMLASDKFFTNSKTTIRSANALILYNLTPGGRCSIRALQACDRFCGGKYTSG